MDPQLRPGSAVDAESSRQLVDRAKRIAEMLKRWNAEDVSSEPEWNVEDIEPLTLRAGTSK